MERLLEAVEKGLTHGSPKVAGKEKKDEGKAE